MTFGCSGQIFSLLVEPLIKILVFQGQVVTFRLYRSNFQISVETMYQNFGVFKVNILILESNFFFAFLQETRGCLFTLLL